jgi:hypothetical protein
VEEGNQYGGMKFYLHAMLCTLSMPLSINTI